MAGRHGVPSPERRAHARVARRQLRRRVQRRDAAQPWLLWLLVRFALAVIVLGAVGWSALLLHRREGGSWPTVAVAAGSLSLVMIGWDVLARRRQRAALRVQTVARMRAAAVPRHRGTEHVDPDPEPRAVFRPEASPEPIPEPTSEPTSEPTGGFVPDPPPRPGRASHRR